MHQPVTNRRTRAEVRARFRTYGFPSCYLTFKHRFRLLRPLESAEGVAVRDMACMATYWAFPASFRSVHKFALLGLSRQRQRLICVLSEFPNCLHQLIESELSIFDRLSARRPSRSVSVRATHLAKRGVGVPQVGLSFYLRSSGHALRMRSFNCNQPRGDLKVGRSRCLKLKAQRKHKQLTIDQ